MVFVSVSIPHPLGDDCEKRIESVIQEVASWTMDVPVSRVYTRLSVLNEQEAGKMNIRVIARFHVWNRIFESHLRTKEQLKMTLEAVLMDCFETIVVTTEGIPSQDFR